MKRKITSQLFLLCATLATAQRYDDTRLFDIIGLPDGNEVGECLAIGVPFLIVGLILIFRCNTKSNHSTDGNNDSWSGCLSIIFIGIALIAMLPLLVWIEAIVTSIVGIVAIVGVIILVIFLFIKWFRGK